MAHTYITECGSDLGKLSTDVSPLVTQARRYMSRVEKALRIHCLVFGGPGAKRYASRWYQVVCLQP